MAAGIALPAVSRYDQSVNAKWLRGANQRYLLYRKLSIPSP